MAHILIVDDQANVRTAVVQLLLSCNRADLSIDQASNGVHALRKLQSKPFSLLICDTEMPGMNGTALMHAVRADDKLKSLPVIMLLAVGAGKKDVQDAVALGISGFVIKPFKPDQLLSQIKKTLSW